MTNRLSTSTLDDAYFGAIYTIESLPPLRLTFSRSPLARPAALSRFAEPWAIITACNPGSVRLSDDQNDRRDHAILTTLTARGHRLTRTIASGQHGEWPEQGWLIESTTRTEVLDLARDFGQRAVVHSESGQTGLLFTDTGRWIIRPIEVTQQRDAPVDRAANRAGPR